MPRRFLQLPKISFVIVFTALLVLSAIFAFLNTKSVLASNSDIDCIGSAIANYAADVFESLGTSSQNSYGNVHFLSPVFNMTTDDFPPLIEKFNAELNSRGYSLDNFSAIAGNAYNVSWGKRTISGFVGTARGTAIGQRPIILTETGWYQIEEGKRGQAVIELKNEISLVKENNVIGQLLFKVFYHNSSDPSVMSDDEINQVCSGNCYQYGVGANSASYYSSPDESFYKRAQEHNMKYTLEIADNNITSVMTGIERAHNGGLIPIVRIGVGSNSGGFDNPEDLASFIKELNNRVSQIVYIIIGPNEPLNESWASPNCQYQGSQDPIIISGASVVSCDFIQDNSSNREASSSSVPHNSQGLEGDIHLISSKMSDFKTAQGIMSGALYKLLPQVLAKNVSLPGNATMYFKHSVQGLEEGSRDVFDPDTTIPCNEAPSEKTTLLAQNWGYLVGGVRGLSSFLAPHDPTAPVDRFRFQIADTSYTCTGSFAPGEKVEAIELPETDDRNTSFSILGWINRIINSIKDFIANYTEVKKVKVLTRSRLPAGSAATKLMTGVARGSLPGEISEIITPRDEARALMAGFEYSLSFSPPVETGERPASYFEIKKLRNFYCLDLCSRLPQDINISNIDPLCPSCDPDDYKTPFQPIPQPPSLPPGCHWNSAYGCDYYTCKLGEDRGDGTLCEQSCELDPICESGLCDENKLYTDPRLPNGDYCSQKQCHPGDCHWDHYDKPSSYYHDDLPDGFPQGGPPWGPGFYANPDVCVQKDGGGMCNPDCCQ